MDEAMIRRLIGWRQKAAFLAYGNKRKNMKKMEVLTFTHPTLGEICGMEIDGKPWLVGKDVAVALGYKNPQLAIRTHIEDKDKGMTKILTPGGRQNVPMINENGFYSLAFKSKLPNAKEIREWVSVHVFSQLKHEMDKIENPV